MHGRGLGNGRDAPLTHPFPLDRSQQESVLRNARRNVLLKLTLTYLRGVLRSTHTNAEDFMFIKSVLQRVGAVVAITLIASCMVNVDEDSRGESLESSEQPLTSCSSNCDCPLGFYCGGGSCVDVDFGPMPEYVPCYGDCQCNANQYCNGQRQCKPRLPACGPCSAGKDCHCGVVCWPKNLACP